MTRYLFMLLAVMRKELRQTVRDKRMMVLLIAVPAIQLIIFGNAVQFDVDRVPTAVVDLDQTQLSRTHLRRVLADGTLRKVQETESTSQALRMLETGQAAAVLVVPYGFAKDAVRGRGATVQMVLDGSDPNRANVAAAAVAGYFAERSEESLRLRATQQANAQGRVSELPNVSVRSRVLFNPALKTAIYMVPGISSMLLLLITTIVSSMGLARERERGTLEQIQVTPLPSGLLILGKILPFAVIGLFDFLLALVVGSYGFGMPVRGSMVFLFGGTALYLINTLGMGLLISTISSSQQQAFMGGFLFMLPAALLSGIMTPVRSMPGWLAPWTLLNPLRHYAEIVRGVLLRGASAADLSQQLLALTAMGLVICTVAALRFRKKQG
ncbi:MAG TPA: ABC transporter permease [Polyangiales bacterium]|nr:ABC transporter permease [Polyangiales bacterium]